MQRDGKEGDGCPPLAIGAAKLLYEQGSKERERRENIGSAHTEKMKGEGSYKATFSFIDNDIFVLLSDNFDSAKRQTLVPHISSSEDQEVLKVLVRAKTKSCSKLSYLSTN